MRDGTSDRLLGDVQPVPTDIDHTAEYLAAAFDQSQFRTGTNTYTNDFAPTGADRTGGGVGGRTGGGGADRTGGGGGVTTSSTAATQSLEEMDATHSWIENPLNEFEIYTYNLELFVVSQEDTITYLNGAEIGNSGEEPGTNKLVIAHTAETTEFIISDLSFITLGTSYSSNIGLAGAATTFEFVITQIGDTNLAETFDNVAASMG